MQLNILKTVGHFLGGIVSSAGGAILTTPVNPSQNAAAMALPALANGATSAVSAILPEPHSYLGQAIHAAGGFLAVLAVAHFMHLAPDQQVIQALLSAATSSMSAGSPSTKQ